MNLLVDVTGGSDASSTGDMRTGSWVAVMGQTVVVIGTLDVITDVPLSCGMVM